MTPPHGYSILEISNITLFEATQASSTASLAVNGYLPSGTYSYEYAYSVFGQRGPFHSSLRSDDVINWIGQGAGNRDFPRSHVESLLLLFFGAIWLIMMGAVVVARWPRYKVRFPFATLVVMASVLSVYIFIGSGTEVQFFSSLTTFRLPLEFLFHGYDDHIVYNLFFFAIVGVILESAFRIRRKVRLFVGFFVLPLVADSLLFGLLYYREMFFRLSLRTFPWVYRLQLNRSHGSAGPMYCTGNGRSPKGGITSLFFF